MNHSATAIDSIGKTFNRTTHRAFWTATTEFISDECNQTLLTYVNGTIQNESTLFQEILLWDGSNMVYTTLIESNIQGFDLNVYDFQMLVPEKGWAGPVTSTNYYFYVELV